MALGIDSAAHEGALEVNGRTVAVLGCGADVVYPPSNNKLMQSILNSGAIISEFPPGSKPENWMFPQRNRIISGLSLGVIVIEGHYDSGAMITAKLALDQGREVFAVPGNVELDQSKGPHWLIKQGAKLVESVEDVLEELNMVIPESRTRITEHRTPDLSNLPPDERKIVSVLSLEPKHIDGISVETDLSIPQVSSLLMMLEVKKIVRQLPGKVFVLYPVP
jgi:DNA processing protein